MPINPNIESTWLKALNPEFTSPYFTELKAFLINEKKEHVIFPKGEHIFEALNKTPLPKIKVVILGQDPYHGNGQANGLCFSVNPGIPIPPSLKNIYKELKTDIDMAIPESGDLSSWAEQGVLLLNSVLTVRAEQAASHKNKGWEIFTDAIIKNISINLKDVIFILWGNYAKNKVKHIDLSKHHIFSSAHPSPFSAYNGFFGNHHFSKTNQLLISLNKTPIHWDSIL